MARAVLVAIFRAIIRLYFRAIERIGEPPTADVRGRVFVANHYNALIDPVVVLTAAPCPIAPIAKAPLWKIRGLAWLLDAAGAVPIVRAKDEPGKPPGANDATFARVARHLADGGNVLIFHEGISHSAPKLAPLKTGAARMLAAAAALGGVAPTFQAVALEFDAAHTFRSRCLLVWGPARAWAEVDGAPAERVARATAQMADDLGGLLVEADTHDERRRIAQVAEMLADDAGDDTLAAWSTIGRQVEIAPQALTRLAPTELATARAAVDAYRALLDRHGVRDAQLARGRTPPPRSPIRWVRRVALAPLVVAGVALYALPYRLPRRIARSGEPDVISTYKLGAGLVVFPLWALALTVAAWIWLATPLAAAATAVAWLSPLAALRWLDWRDRRDRPLTAAQLAALVAARAGAMAAIEGARAHLTTPG